MSPVCPSRPTSHAPPPFLCQEAAARVPVRGGDGALASGSCVSPPALNLPGCWDGGQVLSRGLSLPPLVLTGCRRPGRFPVVLAPLVIKLSPVPPCGCPWVSCQEPDETDPWDYLLKPSICCCFLMLLLWSECTTRRFFGIYQGYLVA